MSTKSFDMNKLSLLDGKFKNYNDFIKSQFELYPFDLDDFQKHSIEKILLNENILITAATGSGKSLSAEYSIINAWKKGKKSIYTSPIKSLSNQKFFEFNKKFKDISFGILTGDIKFNPDADCIIMTTEILRNLLYKKQYDTNNINYKLDLDIDLVNDVDSIIFDEVHYINDKDRGKVWEECLVLLPKQINLVLLSATINNADEFALWLQKIKNKPCHLIPKKERIIPLNHFVFYTSKYPKKSKNKEELSKLINKRANKLVHIMDNNRNFNEINYHEVNKLKELDYLSYNSFSNEVIVIQKLVSLLQRKDMLPALFFVLSRKRCLKLANCIEHSLVTQQEITQIKNIVHYHIHRLDNPNLYIDSDEYRDIERLIYKGVAIHHSGLRPVFKEIIEILYGNGLIKVLFATETFAIGINMPTKTVVFSDVKKFTNDDHRFLKTSEYLQMAGRAGRRGIDTMGTVILLGNLIDIKDISNIKKMMTGATENIVSKFDINYNFILKILLNNDYDSLNFFKNTLIFKQNNKYSNDLKNRYVELDNHLKNINLLFDKYDKYYLLKYDTEKLNKNQKKYIKKLENEENFKQNYDLYLENYELNNEYKYLEEQVKNLDYNNYIFESLGNVLKFLQHHQYISNFNSIVDLSNVVVEKKGILSSQINECNEILLTELLVNGFFDDLNDEQICGLLSVFSNTKCLTDDMKVYNCDVLDIDNKLKEKIQKLDKLKEDFEKSVLEHNITISTNWELNYDMIEYNYKWCKGDSFNSLNFDNYIGNFIKDVLKLDNVISTLEILCSNIEKVDLFNKLNGIHTKLLRDIVTSESLYIKM